MLDRLKSIGNPYVNDVKRDHNVSPIIYYIYQGTRVGGRVFLRRNVPQYWNDHAKRRDNQDTQWVSIYEFLKQN